MSWVVELELTLTSSTCHKPDADLTGVLAKQEQNVRSRTGADPMSVKTREGLRPRSGPRALWEESGSHFFGLREGWPGNANQLISIKNNGEEGGLKRSLYNTTKFWPHNGAEGENLINFKMPVCPECRPNALKRFYFSSLENSSRPDMSSDVLWLRWIAVHWKDTQTLTLMLCCTFDIFGSSYYR